jgi:capsular polysaccharide export protein
MFRKGIAEFRHKRILMLQGPVGPFFRRLARDLGKEGAQVVKVDFNGGDWLFSPRNSLSYRGGIEDWPARLDALISDLRIEIILLFGEARPIHRAVYEIAHRRGVVVGVFEEGYIRPDYVTLEQCGVNGCSPIPRNPDFYRKRGKRVSPATIRVGNTFWHAALWAALYYLAAAMARPFFSRYQHHRPLTLWEAGPWLRALWRKWYYASQEQGVETRLSGELSKRFFLVPLQVHNDAQIHAHSRFLSIESFIREVVESFARNAPPDTALVVKHHPRDRGYSDYTRLIRELAREHGLETRLHYVHDLHLPTLLNHARGVVVVNSTVGLSAQFHKAPVMVCGDALYDMAGMTFNGPLDSFWREAENLVVDRVLFQRFVDYLILCTQLNGSFYKRLKIPGSCAGLVWGNAPNPGGADKEVICVDDENN